MNGKNNNNQIGYNIIYYLNSRSPMRNIIVYSVGVDNIYVYMYIFTVSCNI